MPWDFRLAIGFAIVALLASFLIQKGRPVIIVVMAIVIISRFWQPTDNIIFHIIVWTIYSGLLWLVGWKLLENSPAITEAWPYTLLSIGIAAAVGYWILAGRLHWEAWSTLSGALLLGATIFWFTTF